MKTGFDAQWDKVPYTDYTFEHSGRLLDKIMEYLDVDFFTLDEAKDLSTAYRKNDHSRGRQVWGERHLDCLVYQGLIEATSCGSAFQVTSKALQEAAP